MASSTHKLFNVTVLLALALASTSLSARSPTSHGAMLAARLKVDGEGDGGESSKCWDSLFQLQACTGEVISFFLNGETYLGPSCCRAIKVVGHDCWPEVLGSLGFTAEEADVLLGYCDDEEELHSSTPSPTVIDDITP